MTIKKVFIQGGNKMFEYLTYIVVKDLMIMTGVSLGVVIFKDVKVKIQRGK